MNKLVYLILDPNGKVLAIYDDKILAEKMVDTVATKFKTTAIVDERSVNLPIENIGLFK